MDTLATDQRAELAEIEAVLRADRADDEPAGVVTIPGLGGIGKTALAMQAVRDGLEIARALHDPLFEIRVLTDLLAPELNDDLPAAVSLGEHAFAVARGINYPYLLAGVLDKLALLHAEAGDDTAADRATREAATVRARIR